jgi:hypothetical protein
MSSHHIGGRESELLEFRGKEPIGILMFENLKSRNGCGPSILKGRVAEIEAFEKNPDRKVHRHIGVQHFGKFFSPFSCAHQLWDFLSSVSSAFSSHVVVSVYPPGKYVAHLQAIIYRFPSTLSPFVFSLCLKYTNRVLALIPLDVCIRVLSFSGFPCLKSTDKIQSYDTTLRRHKKKTPISLILLPLIKMRLKLIFYMRVSSSSSLQSTYPIQLH